MCFCFVQGTKIQGSVVGKAMIEDYKTRVVEGHTYRMANFVVTANEGLYRATNNPFKLLITPRTYVTERENFFIDFPIKLWTLGDVLRVNKDNNIDYLIGNYSSHY